MIRLSLKYTQIVYRFKWNNNYYFGRKIYKYLNLPLINSIVQVLETPIILIPFFICPMNAINIKFYGPSLVFMKHLMLCMEFQFYSCTPQSTFFSFFRFSRESSKYTHTHIRLYITIMYRSVSFQFEHPLSIQTIVFLTLLLSFIRIMSNYTHIHILLS